MINNKFLLILLLFIGFLIFGFNPFHNSIDPEKTLISNNEIYETKTQRLRDGSYLVAVRTEMPKVKAEMVKWWFTDYLQTTQHYKMWHPEDHLWMDWENKESGKIIGASHLVHEYIGEEIQKLRIQFVDPLEFFKNDPNNKNLFALCAKAGLLEEQVNLAKMCHVVIDTESGAEMRSRFWMGHVVKRKDNNEIRSIESFIGNMFLTRSLVLKKSDAEDLKIHAQEEMKYLAEILPELFNSKNKL